MWGGGGFGGEGGGEREWKVVVRTFWVFSRPLKK